MGERTLGVADYPLAEKVPELIEGPRGKPLTDITLERVMRAM